MKKLLSLILTVVFSMSCLLFCGCAVLLVFGGCAGAKVYERLEKTAPESTYKGQGRKRTFVLVKGRDNKIYMVQSPNSTDPLNDPLFVPGREGDK
jgi:hypothetical protein